MMRFKEFVSAVSSFHIFLQKNMVECRWTWLLLGIKVCRFSQFFIMLFVILEINCEWSFWNVQRFEWTLHPSSGTVEAINGVECPLETLDISKAPYTVYFQDYKQHYFQVVRLFCSIVSSSNMEFSSFRLQYMSLVQLDSSCK